METSDRTLRLTTQAFLISIHHSDYQTMTDEKFRMQFSRLAVQLHWTATRTIFFFFLFYLHGLGLLACGHSAVTNSKICILQRVSRPPWTDDQSVARSLPIQDNINTEETLTNIHASSGIRTHDHSFERGKIFGALDRAVTVIGI
jgi:hypothetical protein